MNPDRELKTIESKGEMTQSTESTEKRDKTYAGRFWERLRDRGLNKEELAKERGNLMEDIRRMGEQGELRISISGDKLSDQEKERLSAIRLLAQEMNFKIGGFYVDKDKAMAIAKVEKIPTQGEIETKDAQELQKVREELGTVDQSGYEEYLSKSETKVRRPHDPTQKEAEEALKRIEEDLQSRRKRESKS